VVVTSAHEIERVTELGEDSEGLGAPSNGQMALEPTTSNGGDDTHPHGEDGEATGNFKAFLNNPGPRYGLPGYKESHNWEQGVDIFSPVIFDPLFYAAKYGLTQNTTDQVKLDWSTKGLSGESPGCRQVTPRGLEIPDNHSMFRRLRCSVSISMPTIILRLQW
jgi:hypothetical protein